MKIIAMNFKEVLFVLALALKPLYIGNSGTLQISDLIYITLFCICILRGKLLFPGKREINWIGIFAILIIYQLCVNIMAYSLTSQKGYTDVRFFKSNLYYIFNLIVCLTVFQMYFEVGYNKLLKLFLIGLSLAIVVCYIGIFTHFTGEGRERGFFNNPNQLGYFAIIVMTVFVIYSRQLPNAIRMVMIALCIVLNVMSLSKASIIGSAALLIIYAIISSDKRGIRRTATIIILISIVTAFLYIMMFSNVQLFAGNYYIRTMRRRLLMMQYENDTNLGQGRGYDRIKEIGIFILTGVGEGAYDRFTVASRKELHSMYASIIVSYGLLAFMGYLYLFKQALFSNRQRLFSMLAFSGILLYCVSHNGIRNTLLWTLLAMLLLRAYDPTYLEKNH